MCWIPYKKKWIWNFGFIIKNHKRNSIHSIQKPRNMNFWHWDLHEIIVKYSTTIVTITWHIIVINIYTVICREVIVTIDADCSNSLRSQCQCWINSNFLPFFSRIQKSSAWTFDELFFPRQVIKSEWFNAKYILWLHSILAWFYTQRFKKSPQYGIHWNCSKFTKKLK